MPKLPKQIQKREKEKLSNIKGSSQQKAAAGGAPSRAMRRKMSQQGIDGMEQINATEVIIKCPDKEIIIKDPQVIRLKQQGMTIHQIVGEPLESEYESGQDTGEDETVESEETDEEEVSDETETESKGPIQEQDVMLVSAQAGVSPEVAKAALEEAEGDLARAILKLKTRG
jgi:nascent polypeptide-associated complex subunit alpha